VLGVAADAADDELRKAYRLRLRQTHPDTGGDAALFVQVQRAWELVGTPDARSAYDRGHGFGASAPSYGPDGDGGGAGTSWRPPSRPADTRPRARSFGQPGGWRRERYLDLIREWAGRGTELPDPYDPALVRAAPRELKRMLADALAEGQRVSSVTWEWGTRCGTTSPWTRVIRREGRSHRARTERPLRSAQRGSRWAGATAPR
jgi:curved DNA-binding protein CbpA